MASHLGDVDVVQLLDSRLDLVLVGLDVADEDQGVVVLDLLHGRLGGQGVLDDVVSIHAVPAGSRLARVLGGPGRPEGLWPVELDTGPDLREDFSKRYHKLIVMRLVTFLTLVPWTPFTTFFWTFLAFWTAATGALS